MKRKFKVEDLYEETDFTNMTDEDIQRGIEELEKASILGKKIIAELQFLKDKKNGKNL